LLSFDQRRQVNEASQLSKLPDGADLDLEALRARIRQQAAVLRAAAERKPAAELPFNWPQVQACLAGAARLAAAPTVVPPLGRWRGLTRLAARLVLRGFLSLSRVITLRQGEVNGRLIEALRETGEGLRRLEQQVTRQHERIRQLESLLWCEEARKTAS
jgi:hypothetical protein